MIKKLTKSPWFYTAVGFMLIIICWFVFYIILGNSFVLPSPIETLKEGVKVLGKAYFYSNLGSTLLRVLIAFIVSLVLSAISVLLSKINWVLKGFFSAVSAFLRSLPTLAVILLILVTVSRSNAPIIVCVLSLYPLIFTIIETAFFKVDDKVKVMCKLYNVPKRKYFFKVLLRGAMPSLLSELLSALAFALKLIISAEILSLCYTGLGGIMNEASLYDNTTLLFAETLIVCIIGLIIEIISKTFVKGGQYEDS